MAQARSLVEVCQRGPPDVVLSINAGVLDPHIIRCASAQRIYDPKMYTKGVPRSGGVNTYRAGTVERRVKCATCHNGPDRCPGHMCHMDCHFPMYQYGFLGYILRILRSVCFFDMKPLSAAAAKLTDAVHPQPGEGLPFAGDSRGVHLYYNFPSPTAKEAAVCIHCGRPQPVYKKEAVSIGATWNKDKVAVAVAEGKMSEADVQHTQRRFSQRVALTILEGVENWVYEAMGFRPKQSHPSWMVMSTMVVPAITIRPPISESDGSRTRGQNDYTQRLKTIVKLNTNIGKVYGRCYPHLVEPCGIYIPRIKNGNIEGLRLNPTKALTEGQQAIRAKMMALQRAATAELPKRHEWPMLPYVWRLTADTEEHVMTEEDLEELYALVEEMQIEVASMADSKVASKVTSALASAGGATGGAAAAAAASADSNKPSVRSFVTDNNGKGGGFRTHLIAKRGDKGGRGVITGSPYIDIDGFGVPASECMKAIYPERVTERNIDRLQAAVNRGPRALVGAKAVIDTGGRRTILLPGKRPPTLRVGDTVRRHLGTGDVLIVNRQPSLHKFSMMGHRVVAVPDDTFLLNPACTIAYGADFDGDEMNFHVPQTEEGRAEVITLMMVGANVISPQANAPIIGFVQDPVIGARLLTSRDTFLTRSQMMDCIMSVRCERPADLIPRPAIIKAPGVVGPLWTGKQAASVVLPAGLHYRKRLAPQGVDQARDVNKRDLSDDYVRVNGGELLSGTLCKQTLGASHGSLIHVIARDFASRAVRVISDMQLLFIEYVQRRGFSTGIMDCLPAPGARPAARCLLRETERAMEVAREIGRANPRVDRAYVDAAVHRIADSALIEVNSITSAVAYASNGNRAEENRMVLMGRAGSKGSIMNSVQMRYAVGQQNVSGGHIAPDEHGRTLPGCRVADNPFSCGFIATPYTDGLRADEFFFHMMPGREGLTAVAVSVSVIGYLQRKMVTLLTTLRMLPDVGIITNAIGEVIQFCYGGDGSDGTRVEHVPWPFAAFTNERLYEEFGEKGTPAGERQVSGIAEVAARVRRSLAPGRDDPGLKRTILSPVHVLRLARRLVKGQPHDGGSGFVTPDELIDEVDRLCAYIRSKAGSLLPQNIVGVDATVRGTQHLEALVRTGLTVKRLVRKWRITRAALAQLVAAIEVACERHRNDPGELLGQLAGQCVGEPLTQMTLDMFHHAGVDNISVTKGVPHLKELLDATAKLKRPSLVVHLKSPWNRTRRGALLAIAGIVGVALGDVVKGGASLVSESNYDPLMARIVKSKRHVATWGVVYTMKRPKPSLYSAPHRLTVHDVARAISASFAGPRRSVPQTYGLALHAADTVPCVYVADHDTIHVRLPHAATCMARRLLDARCTAKQHDQFLHAMACNFHSQLMQRVTLRGLKDISCAVANRNEKTGEWFVHAQVRGPNAKNKHGIVLADVMAMAPVDARRTFSNDMHDANAVLGIEAAANTIFHEMWNAVCGPSHKVDPRHFHILTDTMTYRGIMGLSRHGVNKIETGFPGNAAFERTAVVLFEAAALAKKARVGNGTVIEEIILGQRARFGTGMVMLVDDSDRHCLLSAIPTPSSAFEGEYVTTTLDDLGLDEMPAQQHMDEYDPEHPSIGTTAMDVDAAPVMESIPPLQCESTKPLPGDDVQCTFAPSSPSSAAYWGMPERQ
jgi:DNA-directed RNA polymerase II subunit RPB1